MRIRDGVTEFVINGYTRHDAPMVHTPQCAHVRWNFPPHQPEVLTEVYQRWASTGSPAHNGVRRLDLLEVLLRESQQPDARVGMCWHCVVEKGQEEVA